MPRLATSLCALVLIATVSLLHAQPAIDPDEGVKHIDWKDAKDAVGQTVYVSGKIVTVGKTNRIAFLNFDSERPPGFVAVIFNDHWDKFPGDLRELYQGKIVEIRGLVTTYQDKPQLVVTRPEQIKVLDAMPATEKIESTPVTTWSDDPNQIVICTFNSLNLFDDVDDPYTNDEGTPAKSREAMEQWAAAIRKINPDVISLQEVENRGYLERFNKIFLADMGYNYVVHFDGNDLRGIDVALLSRAPIGEVTSRRHLPFTGPDGVERGFQRDVPAITVLPKDAEPGDSPLFNRAVLFPTTAETLHGFPGPLRCPPDRSRRSASVFYWSPDYDAVKAGAPITFLPGLRQTRMRAFARSLVPPIAFRLRDGLRSALGRGRREV